VPLLNDTSTQFRDLLSNARHDARAYQQLLRRVFCYWQEASHTAPGIETWPEFAARVAQMIRELVRDTAPGGTTIAVTSGAIVAVAAQQALALSDRSAYGMFEVMMNASITRFLHDRRRISLASFNECSYLVLQEQRARAGELRTYR
jgi:broad specificity phosphatase PhoE